MYSLQQAQELQSLTRGYFYTSEAQAIQNCADEYGLKIPYVNEVCEYCDGEGKRALHGMVLSPESTEDLDFMEDYMAGRYDTVCEDCKGLRVVKVPDWKRMDRRTKKLLKAWLRDTRAANAESLAEARMGC